MGTILPTKRPRVSLTLRGREVLCVVREDDDAEWLDETEARVKLRRYPETSTESANLRPRLTRACGEDAITLTTFFFYFRFIHIVLNNRVGRLCPRLQTPKLPYKEVSMNTVARRRTLGNTKMLISSTIVKSSCLYLSRSGTLGGPELTRSSLSPQSVTDQPNLLQWSVDYPNVA
ncbi:hypothetical protein EVAR_34797_1 [Eumeta japonica]|uniref:Uncharacterized protein n=1 Tax=Eumeta variegata TaxID=151549 RepID=A0A4C1WDP7_EUMVA|nr:hypothetical protein EVAR_34797_1 [Eumeta japonica]